MTTRQDIPYLKDPIAHNIVMALLEAKHGTQVFEALKCVPFDNLHDMFHMISHILHENKYKFKTFEEHVK